MAILLPLFPLFTLNHPNSTYLNPVSIAVDRGSMRRVEEITAPPCTATLKILKVGQSDDQCCSRNLTSTRGREQPLNPDITLTPFGSANESALLSFPLTWRMAGPYAFRTQQGKGIYDYLHDAASRMKRDDVMMVILGPSSDDTAKFIQHLLPRDTPIPNPHGRDLGHNDPPCTSYIQPFPSWRNQHFKRLDAKRLMIVQTPGIDITGLSAPECLEEFIQTATRARPDGLTFPTCVIIMFPIEYRSTQAGLTVEHGGEPHLRPGRTPLSQAIGGAPTCALVTTGWSHIADDIGRSRERILSKMLWGDKAEDALAFRQLDDSPQESTWLCVDALIGRLAEQAPRRAALPAISFVTRWLSSVAKESQAEGTAPRPFRRPRTISSRYSSKPPSLYVTPPTSPVEETFPVIQPRPRRVSGLRATLHTNRLSGRISFVEVATDGGSSWVEGDRVSSEGMSTELKARRSWFENFECSGLGSSSWEEFDGDIHRRSLGSGSWDEVEGGVEDGDRGESEEELEEEQGEDAAPEDNACGSVVGNAVRLSEEEELSEVITEYSGETEWGERGGGNLPGCPDINRTGEEPASHIPEPRIVVEHELMTTVASAFPSDIPHTRVGAVGVPTPLLSTTPTSVTIALPPELFRVSHNGSLSSMASFSSVEETESTVASSSNNANGGGTHYLGGASHFGIKTFNVVNVNVTVNV
ncbi:hypothetical protein FA13DRAFT_1726976 [Coprinellus micaceus]|uniref:Uncharacterized protein n=1 Tax=Coprinellus micaceus TaxID=71717 RepID=A0A4Y7TQZ7_COPMI|nr:hypothetical protein FA13DRAFT_1726976 [Coprinellus micaceus]